VYLRLGFVRLGPRVCLGLGRIEFLLKPRVALFAVASKSNVFFKDSLNFENLIFLLTIKSGKEIIWGRRMSVVE